MNAMTQWVHGWKKKGWIKSDGKPIENPELIKELYTLCYASGMKVAWQKVKAHQSPGSRYYDRFNDHVDKLATGEKKPEVGI
jgi:ribonuclease HI